MRHQQLSELNELDGGDSRGNDYAREVYSYSAY